MSRDNAIAKALHEAEQGRAAAAIAALRIRLRVRPDDPECLAALGMILLRTGQQEQAIAHFERAAALRPHDAMSHSNLANAYMLGSRRHADAARHYARAIELEPGHPLAMLGLCHCKMLMLQCDEAVAVAERGLEARPGWPEMTTNHCLALAAADRLEDAIGAMRAALERDPGNRTVRSQYLLSLNYLALPPEEIAREHRMVSRSIPAGADPADTGSDPDRPLRVGVLSADLGEHAVGHFAHAPLSALPEGWSLTAFALDRGERSAARDRFRRLAGEWVECGALAPEAVDAEIRARRIDVLVELGGHTGSGRLAELDRKPAPVVVSAIGYPNTTGHPAVDWRVVDSITDPPGAEALCTERLMRLDPCFLCYRPPDDAPDPEMPDAASPVTFGSFNLVSKVRGSTIALWARVLAEVPGSRLLLKSKSLGDAGARERLLARLAAGGIDPARVDAIAFTERRSDHLRLYSRMHVALDTTPYNGTTTTCEALWMGVPVVSVRGDRHAARVGASLLQAASCAEFLAEDADGFVRTAVALGRDRERLGALRRSLRERMMGSVLLDAKGYSERFHAALRTAWRGHCASRGPAAS